MPAANSPSEIDDQPDDEADGGADQSQVIEAGEGLRRQLFPFGQVEHQREHRDHAYTEADRPAEHRPAGKPPAFHVQLDIITQILGKKPSSMSRPLARAGAASLLLLAVLAGRSSAETPLIMAFTPSRDPTALQEAGDAFVRTVTRLSGVPMRAQVASDYAGVVEALRSRRVDLAFVHPVGYVLANREAGCQILVRDVWQGRTAYAARFYVRKGTGIERLEDLRGKTIAFVDPASSSGYIYPMVLLIKRGLVRDRDPKTFFKDALFAGTHDAALLSLVHGRVDAVATFDKAPELHLKDPALINQLAAVGETPEIPEAGICARPGLPADAVARVKRALLSMKGPEHAAVLKATYDIDGFAEASDRDYEPVREAMTFMGLAPPK
ncbi:MAG: hypothetical protein C5B48_00220 [Candidatus Rokuibacteriota bacterium]|nr:MAG: hypothetical protein C5B48_00220 [Candidatus Rokubacteria bacterium]